MAEESAAQNTDTGTILTNPAAAGNDAAAQDWMKDFDEPVRAAIAAKGFKNVGDVAKGWFHAQSMVGADKVALPKDGKWDADSAKKLGIPETPEGYQYKKPELPAGVTWDEKFEKAALPALHALGLTPTQVEGIVGFYAAHQVAQGQGLATQAAQSRQESEAALRTQFGPQYDARVAQATRVIQQLGGPEVQAALNATGAGNNPHLVKLFAKIGALMSEDQLKTGNSGGLGMGSEEAKAEINKLQAHPAWTNREHPEHKQIRAKLDQLYATAYPSAA